MPETLIEMFGHGKFMPHGFCLKWDPALVLVMVLANAGIALAYFAIPLALVVFVRKRRDLAYPWMFRLFGAFIIACGLTHVVKILTIYYSCYWLEAWIDALTAVISLVTAALLWPLIPRALSLPSPGELEKLNLELRTTRDDAIEASKLKSLFVANISHELRTPLSALLGMNELLLSTKLDEEQKLLLNNADTAGKSLLTMVNDLLDLTRLEAGKLGIETAALNVKLLIEEVLSVFRVECEIKGIELKSDTDPNIPEEVFGDPVRIKQVLTNLVANAVKFTNKGSVSVFAELLSPSSESLSVKFTVRDTGIGFDAQDMEQIFEPFGQAQSGGIKHPGAGLGLAISKLLVELMEGEISASSEGKDKGASFSFSVGLFRQSGIHPVEEPELTTLVEPFVGKVLVAEDDRLLQKLAERQLEKFGLSFKIVSSGAVALSEWKTGQYSLILMDCNLPEMDGYTVTSEIRKLETNDRIPIVAMTAGAMEGDRQKCLASGMDDYLSKPYTIKQLADVLNRWLVDVKTSTPHTVSRAETLKSAGSSSGPHEITLTHLKSEAVDLPKLTREMTLAELEKLLPIFSSNAEELIAKIEAALKAQDAVLISKLTHQLKGTARIMYARRMDVICVEIERAAQKNELENIESQINDLKVALKETKEVVATLMHSQHFR